MVVGVNKPHYVELLPMSDKTFTVKCSCGNFEKLPNRHIAKVRAHLHILEKAIEG
jgi:hypothetical protein